MAQGTSKGKGSATTGPPPPKGAAGPSRDDLPPQPSASTMMVPFLMIFILLIFTIPEARIGIAGFSDAAFAPTFGFGGAFPHLTLLAASAILAVVTTTVRHFTTDWLGQGKMAAQNKALSATMREAVRSHNTLRLERARKEQSKLMMENQLRTMDMMKTLLVSMVLGFIIIVWLGVFIHESTDVQTITTPWDLQWNLLAPGPLFGIVPQWMLLFSLLSFPLSQALAAVLKYLDFGRKLHYRPVGSGAGVAGGGAAAAVSLTANQKERTPDYLVLDDEE